MSNDILFSQLQCSAALATEYFVAQQAPNSSDANDGSAQAPWKTLTQAMAKVREGDTVRVSAGVYTESLAPRVNKVSVLAVGDEPVVIAAPVRVVDGKSWEPVPGTRNVYQCRLADLPKKPLLRVDGVAVEFITTVGTEVQTDPSRGIRTTSQVDRPMADTEVRRWTPRGEDLIQINLGGLNPAEHQIDIVDGEFVGIDLQQDGCRVRGFEVRDAYTGILFTGAENIVRECLVFGAYTGALFLDASQNTLRGSALLRCSIGVWVNGIVNGSRENVVEQNLIVGSGYRPLRNRTPQEDAESPWGPGGPVRYGMASFNTLRYNVIADGTWAGWWPDVNCYGNYVYGNVFHRIPERAIYNEYPVNETQILYNAITECGSGLVYRFSWRTNALYNYLSGIGGTAIALWGPHEDNAYAFDNRIAKNVMDDSEVYVTCSDGQGMQDNLPVNWGLKGKLSATARFRMLSNTLYDNRYVSPPRKAFAKVNDIEFDTLEKFRDSTGMETGSRLDAQARMEDLGLALYSIRVPGASRPDLAVPMVGNPLTGIFHANPLPYAGEDDPFFWTQGVGDLSEDRVGQRFAYCYWYEWPHMQPGVRRLIRTQPGFDPAAPRAADAAPGVYMELTGNNLESMHASGGGFWSPWLTTMPGTDITLTWQAQGEGLEPVAADGGPVVLVQFQNHTGQHVQRTLLCGREATGKMVGDMPGDANFPWARHSVTVQASAEAYRVAFFFGLKPAKGTLRFGDIAIRSAAGTPPAVPVAKGSQQYRTLDLSQFLNHPLDADMGAAAGAPPPVAEWMRLNLSSLKPGIRKLGDMPLDVRDQAVTLACHRRPPVTLPFAADGIAVHGNVETLTFLHCGPIGQKGHEFWRYLVHYADGQVMEVVPLGDAVFLAYKEPYFHATATLGLARQIGDAGIGPAMQWVNPRPDVAVTSVDFRSMDLGQAVLLAVTAGEAVK